jgi:cell division protein FtsZ
VEFVVANTDAQQLQHSRAGRRIQLGPHITQGLGAGAKPDIGRAAAEEAADELYRHLDETHMVFITAGMGGGTGTGAAPVIARMARERNVLTVGVVTKPFTFEGQRRARAAEAGILELQQYVDTLIVIPNQNLFRLANERTSWKEAFKMADHVLYMGVRGVTDLMMAPGLVNLDFADIRTVMAEMGKAMMGTGEAEGENRAIRAAEAAISNPLLEDTSMSGARGLLINITGGDDMTLYEVDQAANRIRDEVDDEANIIFGSAIDETLQGKVRVSVVATGIDSHEMTNQRPRLVQMHGGAGFEEPAAPVLLDPAEAAPAEEAPQPVYPATVTPLPRASTPRPASGANPRPASPAASAAVTPHPSARPAPQPDSTVTRPQASPMAPPMAPPLRAPLSQPAQVPLAAAAEPLAARSGLFAEAPRQMPSRPAPAPQPAVAARPSLFGIVTGALRRAPAQTASPALAEGDAFGAYTAEPASIPAPRPTLRPAQTDESGLDIPAFLRRQTS